MFIRKYLYAIIGFMVSVLSGYAFYQKRKADKLEKENAEIADAIVQSEYNHVVDIANAKNEQLKVEDKKIEAPNKPYNPLDL